MHPFNKQSLPEAVGELECFFIYSRKALEHANVCSAALFLTAVQKSDRRRWRPPRRRLGGFASMRSTSERNINHQPMALRNIPAKPVARSTKRFYFALVRALEISDGSGWILKTSCTWYRSRSQQDHSRLELPNARQQFCFTDLHVGFPVDSPSPGPDLNAVQARTQSWPVPVCLLLLHFHA